MVSTQWAMFSVDVWTTHDEALTTEPKIGCPSTVSILHNKWCSVYIFLCHLLHLYLSGLFPNQQTLTDHTPSAHESSSWAQERSLQAFQNASVVPKEPFVDPTCFNMLIQFVESIFVDTIDVDYCWLKQMNPMVWCCFFPNFACCKTRVVRPRRSSVLTSKNVFSNPSPNFLRTGISIS